jgi:hypothetical protein
MMDKRKIRSFIEMVNTLRDSLTDEQASAVPELYPEWKNGKAYKAGERVRHHDKLYKVIDESSNLEDDLTPDVNEKKFVNMPKHGKR